MFCHTKREVLDQLALIVPPGFVEISVADPLHFGVDPDPDPRIHASD